MIRQIHKVIKGYFPSLFDRIKHIKDPRLRRDYDTTELIMGCLSMFLFKEASHNAFNGDREKIMFIENYLKIFKKRLPHMDTVDTFFKLLEPEELELLKAALIAAMIEQKILQRFKLFGKHYMVAIDGTGVSSYTENDSEQSRCSKTSIYGKTTYTHYVVEAKLVTSSGLAISLASEWIANEPDRNFNKQDCEQEAFKRLAIKLKKYFPRLPICILADGLYPTKPFMDICSNNEWFYIVILKDENLKRLQQDLTDIESKHHRSKETLQLSAKGKRHISQKNEWLTQKLEHGGHQLNWFRCTETVTCYNKDGKALPEPKTTKFVWLTNLQTNDTNISNLVKAGRTRWKIENEGFNTQKNLGYNLGHKYCRKSFKGYKNYYQCLQISHLINQLAENSQNIKDMREGNPTLTLQHIWKEMIGWLSHVLIDDNEFKTGTRFQIRLAG